MKKVRGLTIARQNSEFQIFTDEALKHETGLLFLCDGQAPA
jgi:hypothetical protein